MAEIKDKKELLKQLLAEKANKKEQVTSPLSYGQQALWFLHQNAPDNAAYNIAFTTRIRSSINQDAWKKAFQRLLNRHPILRTTYDLKDGELKQSVHGYMPLDYSYHDASHLEGKAFDQFVKDIYEQPFNLEAGPIGRFALIKQDEDNHVLLYTVHHIACDGVSTWLMLQELRELYTAEVEARKPELPNLKKSYADFVQYQRNLLQGEQGEKLWSYWKEQLAGPLPTLDMPTDKARPLVQTYGGSSTSIHLDNQLTESLRNLAKEQGVTLFVVLASAFELLLHRLTGQDDIIIGTPTTGRDKKDFQQIVGYFVNPVALRARFDDDPTFADLLQRNRETILGAIAHQEFPFPQLVEKLQIPRDNSRSPIFQVFFSLLKVQGDDVVQNLLAGEEGESFQWGPLKLEAYDLEQQEGQFDITMALQESKGTVGGKLKYNTDLWEAESMERFTSHFTSLLENIAADPTRPASQYDLLTETDKNWLIHELNQTETPFPADKCMHHLFEERVDQQPDTIALSMPALAEVEKASQFTYRMLDEHANQLAHELQKRGIGPESKVGICVHRSPEMIIGILGILKAGGAYVPLDPDYPAERLEYIIEDAGLEIVLTQENAAEHLPKSSSTLLFMDKDWDQIDQHSKERPGSEVKPNNLAYIIYTSGSTGKPKGVLIEHHGVVNKLTNFKQDIEFDHSYRFTLIASYAFDASVGQMYLPLVKGSPLFLMPKDKQTDPEYFWDFMFENRINVIYTAASFLNPMLDVPRDLKDLEVKAIFLGAEKFPRSLLLKIHEKLNAEKIVNMYGPTETTVNCVMHTVEGVPEGSIPLGTPLPNYKAYLLDKHNQIVPPGVTGEIHIGGPAVARGYHNRPELTAKHFIPSPFSNDPNDRLYKSGDLGKYLPDGKLAFMGRIDKQVKVNGYRIEPGEVEAAILQHNHLKDVLVMAREDASGQNRLVAYMIPTHGEEVPAIDEMRSFLQGKLPSFMVPTAYVGLDEFPLTPTGKVDTNALPAPGARPKLSTEYVAPRNQREELLCDIWKEVLQVERVGVHDNFFDLGGASVQSIQVVNKANEVGFQLNAGMLFEFQTVEQLAEAGAADFEYKEPESAVPTPIIVEPEPQEEVPDNLRPSFGTDSAHVMIESVGTYLPPKEVTTDEVIAGCKNKIRFPIEKMTGIKSRRMAGEDEFAIDIAIQAAKDALSRSKYQPEEIELVICCNISRYDAPKQVSYEPSTAMKLKKHFGMKNAIVFDLSNACATLWTAINIIDSFVSNGLIKVGMAISGEYITHITQTAMQEIGDSFLDPRMACLTVGDSGAAVILEKSPSKDIGFHNLHMYTESDLCRNCIAQFTDQAHGGAIMVVESVKAAASAIQPGAKLVLDVVKKHNWLPTQDFSYFLMHQTSSTTIADCRREINSLYEQKIATKENTIDNIAHRGNTATTSHWLALMDRSRTGEIKSGDKIVFGISGSGHTLGGALYTFDDLPDRLKNNRKNERNGSNGQAAKALENRSWKAPTPRVSIASIGLLAEEDHVNPDSLEYAKKAVKACIDASDYHRNEIGLLIHTGIYRNRFLSEPAIASLVAGDLDINAHPETTSHNKSLTFDLLNGSIGFLEACMVSMQMMQAGKYHSALISASEIENNAENGGNGRELLGIKETGSAMMLHWDEEGDSGFGNFFFRSYPAYLETYGTYMMWKDDDSFLGILRNPNMNDYYLDCIQKTVDDFLGQEGLSMSDIKLVVPPQVSPSFIHKLSQSMRIPFEKMVDVSTENEDLFTSSMPYALHEVLESDKVEKGDVGLIISVGAGIQVGCALYYF